jgi:uncharacterized protein (TIRG00374 family)
METRAYAGRRAVALSLVFGLPLGGLLLWLALRDVDLSKVGAALKRADVGPIALAVGLLAIVYSLQAERWRRIAGTPDVPWRRFLEMVVSGVACNNVLPGRLGDLLRARWLGLDARLASGRALATVVIDRGFDLATLVVLLLVSLPAMATAAWLDRIIVGGLVALGLLAVALVFARNYTRKRQRERRHRGLVRRVVRDAVEGLAEPLGLRRIAELSALSIVAWSTWAGAAYLVARAVGVELGPMETLFAAAVINLGVGIPSSPGFVGTYQWLGVAGLGLFDVGNTDALAFAILMQAVWYVPTTLAGGAALAIRGPRAFLTLRPRQQANEPVA